MAHSASMIPMLGCANIRVCAPICFHSGARPRSFDTNGWKWWKSLLLSSILYKPLWKSVVKSFWNLFKNESSIVFACFRRALAVLQQVAPVVAATWKAFTDFPSQRAAPWGGWFRRPGPRICATRKCIHIKKITKPEKMGEPLVILLVNGGMIVCSELGNITEVYFSC